MAKSLVTVSVARIENVILFIRGEKVILDSELAKLYGVTTRRLNQQVKRNLERFPSDFMFQLTRKEYNALMLQIATSKGRGGRRKLPFAFTEHGALMAANVLNSKQAVRASRRTPKSCRRLVVTLPIGDCRLPIEKKRTTKSLEATRTEPKQRQAAALKRAAASRQSHCQLPIANCRLPLFSDLWFQRESVACSERPQAGLPDCKFP